MLTPRILKFHEQETKGNEEKGMDDSFYVLVPVQWQVLERARAPLSRILSSGEEKRRQKREVR